MYTIIVISSLMTSSVAGVNFDSSYKAKPTRRIDKYGELTVPNGGPWGTLKHTAFCPPYTYAKGYSQKIEPDQGHGDDTALNNIALLCASKDATTYRSVVVSPEPGFGKWTDPVICEGSGNFMSSFVFNAQAPITGDDTAADYVKFKCRKLFEKGERVIACNYVNTFGIFGQWSDSCRDGFAICGMQTKTEPNQGSGDDSTLNDVKFYCCEIR